MHLHNIPNLLTIYDKICHSSNLISLWLFLILHSLEYIESSLSTDEIESHLEMGRQMLSRGQYNDALSHYHAAVDGDPKNYLTYFKRATVYLALGKSKPALDDLNQVIQLKPDFLSARLQRGSVLLKQGRVDEAHIDLEWVLRYDQFNEEATRLYSMLDPIKRDLQSVYMYIQEDACHEAVDLMTKIIMEMPWDSKLREMRSECFEKIGDFFNAISDLQATTKMNNDDTDGFLKLSKLHYEIGDVEESLSTIRACLKLDPDHKQCKVHYRKVKKLASYLKSLDENSQRENFQECVASANDALEMESKIRNIVHLIKKRQCHCLSKLDNPVEAIKICSQALEINPHDALTLCDRADAYLLNEQSSEAQRDYTKALEAEPGLKRAEEGLRSIKNRRKMSRDYYKILGVKRNAGKKEIIKAYRKLAAKWHPDNFQGEEKKSAEKKFIDIAAAKEVLTDAEKRSKFDAGEDPLDPDSQSNPFGGFHSHGFPFQFGGGRTFTFTFG
ncbi:dnaJ homolog subfamily C member P58IPK [Brevipalpus obovatus]|uniref:dnaJ homolog subfamily C member P58IPK n=1 Tax=Brevipalpus obovatus TaxID=246614 RepID=UPI003D9E995B